MLFCFENGSKGGQNLEHFTYLEGVLNNSIERVKQDKFSKYSRSTKLLFPLLLRCPTLYCVKIRILFLHQISYTSIWDLQSIYGPYLHLSLILK